MHRKGSPVLIWIALWLLIAVTYRPVQAARPDTPIYGRPGEYVVGTTELLIQDADYKDRPLEVAIWYPAVRVPDQQEKTTYVVGFLSGEGTGIRNAVPNDEGKPYPLIIYSHGLGGARYQSVNYTAHLASYGFIVLAVNHTGTSFGAVTLESIYQNFALRPLDILRQLRFAEALSAPDSNLFGGRFAGLIDTDNVGVTGHSFGGYTAMAAAGGRLDLDALQTWCDATTDDTVDPQLFCREGGILAQRAKLAAWRGLPANAPSPWPATTDPRIKAAVLHAPWSAPVFGAKSLGNVTTPTMILVGTADQSAIPERDAYAYYDQVGSPEKRLVTFANGGHVLFVDSCAPVLVAIGQQSNCTDPVWDMERAHDLINHFSTMQFLSSLKHDPDAQKALNSTTPAPFIGIAYKQS